MGNTSSSNTQYAQAYASKIYESLVDQHTGQIVALQDRITGEIIPSVKKVADDLNVYINSNNGALVAIEDRITKQINGVASASETQIKQVVSDLATQGQTINGGRYSQSPRCCLPPATRRGFLQWLPLRADRAFQKARIRATQHKSFLYSA